MDNLSYLKKIEHREKKGWPTVTLLIVIFLGSLATYSLGYSNGLKEGMFRMDKAVSKALEGGYRLGIGKGLEALEEKRLRK